MLADIDVLVDGFTMEKGRYAMRVSRGDVMFRDCIVRNYVTGGGCLEMTPPLLGAMKATFENCQFLGNRSTGGYAAAILRLYLADYGTPGGQWREADLRFSDCTFAANWAVIPGTSGRLGGAINGTYLAYGHQGVLFSARQKAQDDNAKKVSKETLAGRMQLKGSSLYRNGSWDLVDRYNEKDFDWSKVPEKDLPKELKGKSIKQYVLERTLGAAQNSDEEQALIELEAVLDDRIRRAEAGEISRRTVGEIFEQAYREADAPSEP